MNADPMRIRAHAIDAARATDQRWCRTNLGRALTPGRLAAIVDAVIAVLNIENDNGGDD